MGEGGEIHILKMKIQEKNKLVKQNII